MIGAPKNSLHLRNPRLLQHPIFKDLLLMQPFLEFGCDSQRDLVCSNPVATKSGDVEWKRNEYGPCIYVPNDYDFYDTGITNDKLGWYHNTFLLWCSTEDLVGSSIQVALGVWEDSTHFCYLGRNGGALSYLVRTEAGYNYPSFDVPNHDDGHTFMLVGTASANATIVYYNGVAIDTWGGEVNSFGVGGDSIYIGDRQGGYGWDDGTISFAAVWNRPLSAAEIMTLYRWGPNLTSLYEIDPFYGAVGVGTPSFVPAWATNSNQVL